MTNTRHSVNKCKRLSNFNLAMRIAHDLGTEVPAEKIKRIADKLKYRYCILQRNYHDVCILWQIMHSLEEKRSNNATLFPFNIHSNDE